MSLILDALNRSERDRQAIPGLASAHYEVKVATPGRWRHLLWVIPVTLLLLGGGWLLLRGDYRLIVTTPDKRPAATQAESAAESMSTRPPRVPAPVTGRRPSSVAAPAAPAPVSAQADAPVVMPVKRSNENVSALYENKTMPPVAPTAAPTARPNTAAATPQARPLGSVGSDKDSKTPTKPSPVANPAQPEAETSDAAIDVDSLASLAEQELVNSNLSKHPAPFLSSLSQHRKDEIPTMMYSRHDYKGDGGISSVVINGDQFRVGQNVAPGLKLVEILGDSIVLEFHGEEFRLKALNSWVNL